MSPNIPGLVTCLSNIQTSTRLVMVLHAISTYEDRGNLCCLPHTHRSGILPSWHSRMRETSILYDLFLKTSNHMILHQPQQLQASCFYRDQPALINRTLFSYQQVLRTRADTLSRHRNLYMSRTQTTFKIKAIQPAYRSPQNHITLCLKH